MASVLASIITSILESLFLLLHQIQGSRLESDKVYVSLIELLFLLYMHGEIDSKHISLKRELGT